MRRTLDQWRLAALLAALAWCAPALAYPAGSGTCHAIANGGPIPNPDGEFMPARTHHPGDNGGFALVFSEAAYGVGEPLTVTLESDAQDVFIGFLVYAETAGAVRVGSFVPGVQTTFEGALPPPCRGTGHTITQSQANARSMLQLQWTPPLTDQGVLTFRALVLKGASPGTDFFEVTATLAPSPRIFRHGFEGL